MCTHRGGAAALGVGGNPTTTARDTGRGGFETFDDSQSAADALGWTNGGSTDSWLGQLTEAEEDALIDYSDEGYRAVNRALRDFHYMTDDIEERTWALDSAIAKFTLPRGVVTHRGVGADALGLPRSASTAQILARARELIGGEIVDSAYASSGVTRLPLTRGALAQTPIIMHIQTPPGRGHGAFIAPVSVYQEDEFVYPRGSHFQIRGARMEGGKIHIDARWTHRSTD